MKTEIDQVIYFLEQVKKETLLSEAEIPELLEAVCEKNDVKIWAFIGLGKKDRPVFTGSNRLEGFDIILLAAALCRLYFEERINCEEDAECFLSEQILHTISRILQSDVLDWENSRKFYSQELTEEQYEIYCQREDLKLSAMPFLHFPRIRQWTKERDFPEIAELSEGMTHQSTEDIKNKIGESVVALTILAARHNLRIEDCIQAAYEKIKDRINQMPSSASKKEGNL